MIRSNEKNEMNSPIDDTWISLYYSNTNEHI